MLTEERGELGVLRDLNTLVGVATRGPTSVNGAGGPIVANEVCRR